MDTTMTPSEIVSAVRVQFFGPIREAAKMSSDEFILLPETSVSDLIKTISEKYDEAVYAELLDKKALCGLRDDLMITLNELIIDHERASETIIHKGDVVSLFQTFPGGG